MLFSSRCDKKLRGDVSSHQVELFHTAVLSRLTVALDGQVDVVRRHTWSWPSQHWSLWKMRHRGGEVNGDQRAAILNLMREQLEHCPSPLIMGSPDIDRWSEEGLGVCQGSDETFRRTALLRDQYLLGTFSSYLSEARQILQSFDLQPWIRIHGLVRDVVLVHGGGLRSATTPLVFGAVFINVDAVTQPLELIALLVHESSHLALHIKSASQKLVIDSHALLRSPLRFDLRPPLFVLHATYVSANIAKCMLTLSHHLTNSARDRALRLGEEAFYDLEAGLSVFQNSGVLTLQGVELVDGLTEMHRELACQVLSKRASR